MSATQPSAARVAGISTAEGLRFDHAVLANGLTIVGEHNADAASVAVGYFVHTGARDESPEVSGVSHFLEHMLFKGNERMTPEDINRTFDELGADYNAYTSEERTVYFGAVLPDRAPALLELLSELMRPSLRPEDFDMEKNVILEEIAMYQDRPNFRVFELSQERFWNGHPLGNSVLGTSESITDLTRDQMKRYFDRRYSPDSLTLVLAGNYDWDAMRAQAERIAGTWKRFDATRAYPRAAPHGGRDTVVDAAVNRMHVAVYAPGVAVDSDRRYAASLLANVIGHGSGSRLFWELVDKGLADAASLGHEAGEGAGSFTGYISTAPERAQQVVETYLGVLKKTQDDGVTEAEWRRAQRKLATSLTLRAETPVGRLMSLGATFQTLGTYLSVPEVVRKVMATPLSAGAELLAERPFDRTYLFSLGPAALDREG
ncbi:MAG: pitrilysin family protein [Trueperaceae bacterium]